MCCWEPFIIEITPFLKKGENEIEIRVSNTAINQIEGKAQPSGLFGSPLILERISEPTHKSDVISSNKSFTHPSSNKFIKSNYAE